MKSRWKNIFLVVVVLFMVAIAIVPLISMKMNANNTDRYDVVAPIVGVLNVNDVTESSVTLVAEGAIDKGDGLHDEAYSFNCGDNIYSSWQKTNYIVCGQLNEETEYTFSAKVRDVLGNETEYQSVNVKTLAPVTTPILDGTIVYFNPVTGQVCDDYDQKNSLSGNKKGCMKWYTFNSSEYDTSNSTISMILDHNTSVTTSWSHQEQKSEYQYVEPSFVNYVLKSDVSGWNKTIKSSARLITAKEITKITKHPTINIDYPYDPYNNSSYYFETNDSCGDCSSMGVELNRCMCHNIGKGNAKYGWLFDRLTDCEDYGCFNSNSGENIYKDYAYWTNTKVVGFINKAWVINCEGELSIESINYKEAGVRPVITISKSKIMH